MNKNFSDEQLDQILRRIVKDSALNETEIDEIAESPNLWRNVQKSIEETKSSRRRGWIPLWFDWRIAVFAAAVLVVCFGLIRFANERGANNSARIEAVEIPSSETPKPDDSEIAEMPQIDEKEQVGETPVEQKSFPKKFISSKNHSNPKISNKAPNRLVNEIRMAKVQPQTAEIKTDFIALNYSPAAESGQILKVKVPRSMMVSLGVTNKVENSEELVNAEVLVGDDGLARAIRFVQ